MIRRSYYKPEVHIPIVCGSVWTGPILRVGPGLQFTSLSSALNAHTSNIPLLILIYPGTYSESGIIIDKDVFIRGVGINVASIVLSFSDASTSGIILKARALSIVENITINRLSYGYRGCIGYEPVAGFNPLLIFNKSRFTATYNDQYIIRGSGDSPNQFIVRNCYMQRGVSFFDKLDLNKIFVQKCFLNQSMYTTSCTGSFAEDDSTAIGGIDYIGYSWNFGSYFITGVDDINF